MSDLATQYCRCGLFWTLLVLVGLAVTPAKLLAGVVAGEAAATALPAVSATAATVESHVVPMRAPDAPEWRLPAGVVVEEEDRSGTTWRQWGHLNVSLAGAHSAMAKGLGAQGWQRLRLLPFVRSGSELQIWRRGRRQILVMLWSQAVDRTGFAWGPANAAGPGGAPVVPALPETKDDGPPLKR